jgi:hypothetical protein
MNHSPSVSQLAKLTDSGLFELLASSILRRYEPSCKNLIHTGINAQGKTVKSPLDGVTFVEGENPPHLIAVHHTICSERELENKWLHEPTTVRPKKDKPTAPAGDFVKTVAIVKEIRSKYPELKATLILTTNQEPSEALVREINLLATSEQIELRILSRSVLADYLDNYPDGQWYRRQYLGIEQERLSPDLLDKLCRKSLQINRPPDTKEAWIERELDETLSHLVANQIKFLVAHSGMGKTVACYKWISAHLDNGGFGLFIPHDVIAESLTLEQAINITLRKLHPSLPEQFNFSSFSLTKPLYLVVEDINRSGQAAYLLEKIASWNRQLRDETTTDAGRILICPVWPEVLRAVNEQTKSQLEPLLMTAGSFTLEEAKEALRKRAQITSQTISDLALEETALALGNDPLLIALYSPDGPLKPDTIISDFIENSLSRTASLRTENANADYLEAMRHLSHKMLLEKKLEPTWADVRAWFIGDKESDRKLLSHLTQHAELISLNGNSSSQKIGFRHDRVRDWFLTDVIAKMMRDETLDASILSDPFYAHSIGSAMTQPGIKTEVIESVLSHNALSLFYALKHFRTARTEFEHSILGAINEWLDNPNLNAPTRWRQQYEAASVLAETESASVLEFLKRLPILGSVSQIGRLRNGDIGGAIELCVHIEPGVGADWRDRQIEHMKVRFGEKISKVLQSVLETPDLHVQARIGSLRLAGFLADANLADAINYSWQNDPQNREHTAEYLWAFAMCCGGNAEKYLAPVCDEWSQMTDQAQDGNWTSPRYQVIAHELRWAFQKWIPTNALDYLISRSNQKELHEPLLYLLQGLDNVKALLHVVKEFAAQRRERGDYYSFRSSREEWRTAQELGRTMSKPCRDALHLIWNNSSNDQFERREAFSLWAFTVLPEDIETLRTAVIDDVLQEVILRQRLRRGDTEAIPELLDRLTDTNWEGWLLDARSVWCEELTPILENKLEERGLQDPSTWRSHTNEDYALAELLRFADPRTAERIILANWSHLQHSNLFVQSAIYLATPALQAAVQKLVKEHPSPSELFDLISTHLGIGNQFSKGLTRREQLLNLASYIDYMSPLDRYQLWKACNRRGWFELRKKFIDDKLLELNRMVWNEETQISNLDEFAKREPHWIEHWIDDNLKAGISWEEIKSLMSKWLGMRKTIAAFSLVADAVLYAGKRPDIDILNIYPEVDDLSAMFIFADTKYGLERKSLV